jgi:hypothetical protein
MPKPKIDVLEQAELRWPDGWERTRIQDRKSQSAWKKPRGEYRTMLIKELERIGVTSLLITFSNNERVDPGIAVWFSRAKNDFTWQEALGLDTPAPTLAEIDNAFQQKAMKFHPDRPDGGDIGTFQQLVQHRKNAKAWIQGTHEGAHDFAVACDRFTEVRLNMAALRLAFTAFRQLERVGVPAILDRALERTFRQQLTPGGAQ